MFPDIVQSSKVSVLFTATARGKPCFLFKHSLCQLADCRLSLINSTG